MAFPRRLLAALLASIASDLSTLRCVDLTVGRLGAGLLPAAKTHGGPADLVLVDASRAAAALAVADVDTLVLVLCDPETPEHLPGLQQRSRVRTGDISWRLCARATEAPAHQGDSVTVVVPAQDQAAELERLINALAGGPPDLPIHLVVVDCGSIDHTAAFLRSVTGNVSFLQKPRHTSLDEAISAGLQACRTTHALVMSPLWVPEVSWETALLAKLAERPDATALLAKLVMADGKSVVPRTGALGSAVVYRLPVMARGLVVPAPEVRIRVVLPKVRPIARRPAQSTRPANEAPALALPLGQRP